ncbi:MAG: NAD-dependent epimerase/dehydratase family protein [Terrimicrobiaceae bacterium]
MKILITGGAGYIGSVLTPELLLAGYKVTVLDSLLFNQFSLASCVASPNFEFVHGDCRNAELIRTLTKKADVIIPLAAVVGAPLCNRDPYTAQTTNEEAVKMLCRTLSPKQRIILPVTNSGYGIGARSKKCDENSPLRPISLYGRTKVEAEKAVLERGNALSFRFATIFGMSPRMRLDLLVNDFVYRAYRDRALTVFEGHHRRNFLHIRDAVNAFLHALKHFERMKDNAYNVGLEEANLTKIQLCQRIKKHFPDFVFFEASVGEDPDKRDYLVSNKKILSTGFRTKWDLDRGITELKKGYPMLGRNPYGNI